MKLDTMIDDFWTELDRTTAISGLSVYRNFHNNEHHKDMQPDSNFRTLL